MDNRQNNGRGRGYLISLRTRSLTSSGEVNMSLNNGVPLRSTYIPVEPDENDKSIYETGINSGINFEKFNTIDVKVTGQNIPDKIETFEAYNIPIILMDNIKKCKFTKLTPIQKYTFPIILSGKDLMATAQTGSGKTVLNHFISIVKIIIIIIIHHWLLDYIESFSQLSYHSMYLSIIYVGTY